MGEAKRGKLWLRLIKDNKIKRDLVVSASADNIEGALQEGLKRLDIAMPVIIKKHLNEFSAFSQTSFSERDFLEPFCYDKLEIEYFE